MEPCVDLSDNRLKISRAQKRKENRKKDKEKHTVEEKVWVGNVETLFVHSAICS